MPVEGAQAREADKGTLGIMRIFYTFVWVLVSQVCTNIKMFKVYTSDVCMVLYVNLDLIPVFMGGKKKEAKK